MTHISILLIVFCLMAYAKSTHVSINNIHYGFYLNFAGTLSLQDIDNQNNNSNKARIRFTDVAIEKSQIDHNDIPFVQFPNEKQIIIQIDQLMFKEPIEDKPKTHLKFVYEQIPSILVDINVKNESHLDEFLALIDRRCPKYEQL